MIKPALVVILGLSVFAVVASGQQPAPPATSCTICHGDADLFEGDDAAIPAHFANDVHAGVGLSCQSCHGGNPDPALADDMEAAMDPGYAPNPYVGKPERTEIPAFCGRCHSDPEFMKQYSPEARVDQEREYRTSHHGKALAKGDQRVATCIDCHGVHGIRPVGDPDAPVYPTHVAETCGRCHSDPQRMAGTVLPDGRPIPVDQQARWTRSIHAQTMFQRGDLTAPTCNDCHGNHGAAPPGVESVAFVCGQCHGREANLFRASPKHAGFQEHNGYLAEAEGESCAACHEPPEPQAEVKDLRSFLECTTCHGNHAVIRPTMAMLGPVSDTPCALCHEAPDHGSAILDEPRIVAHYTELKAQLSEEADAAGLTGDDRFDWFVDRALTLPTHTETGSAEADQAPRLRPEFERLFKKFRIGKTHFTYLDPVSGAEVKEPVTTCNRCHGPEPALTDAPLGHDAAQEYSRFMNGLMHQTAAAERTLLAAQRGGVEVHEALGELDQAVNAQIEMEVLVHTFSVTDDKRFAEKHDEGLKHAETALELGRAGLAELSNRRKGLYVALAFIFLTAVGLTAQIRRLGD